MPLRSRKRLANIVPITSKLREDEELICINNELLTERTSSKTDINLSSGMLYFLSIGIISDSISLDGFTVRYDEIPEFSSPGI